MTSSSYQRGPWRRNKLLWTFTIGGLVFGILIAAYYHPKETIVEFPEETVDRRIVVGTNTITYNTTGPIITSFYDGCYTTDDFQGGGYYCLVLQYERGPGVVELKIPSYLLKDLIKNYQWIRTIEVDKVTCAISEDRSR